MKKRAQENYMEGRKEERTRIEIRDILNVNSKQMFLPTVKNIDEKEVLYEMLNIRIRLLAKCIIN